MNPLPSPTTPTKCRQVIVTAVYGHHASQLDYTFSTFLQNTTCELHAFVVGHELPQRRVANVHYHLRAPDPAYVHPMRDVDYRRWLLIDELEADLALVVDGMDVLCLRPLEPFAELLKGGCVAAAVEHGGGRYLGGGHYTSNFVNAGVTFWDVAASRPLREAIAERGRRRFRNLVDDQLVLNELLHTTWFDRLTLLPCHYNYRGSLGRKPLGWPRCQSLEGIRIYHNRHWISSARDWMSSPRMTIPELPADRQGPGIWVQRWRRLLCRLRRTGYPPVWPQW